MRVAFRFRTRPAAGLLSRCSGLLLSNLLGCALFAAQLNDSAPLQLPQLGDYQLRVLSPTLLELTLITAKPSGLGRGEPWDFIKRDGQCRLPAAEEIVVLAEGKTNLVKAVGFKRRRSHPRNKD